MSARSSSEDLVDDSGWPLVVIRGPKCYDQATVAATVDPLIAILDRGKRFCIEGDLSETTRFEWAEIRSFQIFLRDHGKRMDDQVTAVALIIPSALVRGAVKVLFKLKPPCFPYRVVQNHEASAIYLARSLAEPGPRTASG